MCYGTFFGMKYPKICAQKCRFVQYYGYYTINGMKFYDDDWEENEYLLSSSVTAIQLKMLRDFDAELLIGIMSYDQKADIYNYVHKYTLSAENNWDCTVTTEGKENSGFAVEEKNDVLVSHNGEQPREINCNTKKDRNGVRLNAITAGVLAFIRPCNIIVSLNELFGSESKTQVYGHLHNLMSKKEMEKTGFVIYDDACHLRKFARNPSRAQTTPTTKKLASIEILVDRMHMRGHIDPWCKRNCGTGRFRDLDKVNTEVCEQVFSWLSRYKRMTKHMNKERFMFFLLYIAHLHNMREVKLRSLP
ncbi:PREDICTED: uncharacterized protein LOC109472414 [Branchiostoma belcheri]|uniref:Uncharacterized protein LOC109472414 n=1 Tax=Branchiostoma belcheri TaxID=7741 RepID=A0A6P4YTR8_BRABE|nr:PREDICTED: uncharacterized protein LOC109472414 [Branchiostoma belcheri]